MHLYEYIFTPPPFHSLLLISAQNSLGDMVE